MVALKYFVALILPICAVVKVAKPLAGYVYKPTVNVALSADCQLTTEPV